MTTTAPCNMQCIPSLNAGGATGLDLLDKERETLSSPVAGSASQCLGFYPVFREVLKLQEIESSVGQRAIECFYSLCEVLDLLRKASVPGKVSPGQLYAAVMAHLEKLQQVHGVAAWIPKCHLPLHLAGMLHKFQILIACFVHERKHKAWCILRWLLSYLEHYQAIF